MTRQITTDADTAARGQRLDNYEIIARLILDGRDTKYIRAYAKEKGWKDKHGNDLNNWTIQNWMKQALKLHYRRQRIAEKDMPKALARRERLYALAIAVKDYSTALRIEQDISRLKGLYPSEKVDVKHSGKVDVNVAQKLWLDVRRYEDEFRLSARAELIESRVEQIGVQDKIDAGMELTSKEKNANFGQPIPEERHDDEPVLEEILVPEVESKNE